MITADDLMQVIDEEEPRHRVSSNTMSGIRETYSIVINRPSGVSANAMKRYIKEAVETWCGTFEPPRPEHALLFGKALNAVVRRRSIMETEVDGSTQ